MGEREIDEFFTTERTEGRAEAVELLTGSYEEYLYEHDDPAIAKWRGMDFRQLSETKRAHPFVQELLAAWRALYDEPFAGVSADGGVLDVWEPVPEAEVDTAPREAAHMLVGLLDDDGRSRALLPMTAPEWRAWSNPEFVIHEVGLRLEEQPEDLVRAALAVVDASLSHEGSERVREAMDLNGFLGELVDLPAIMNNRSYWFTLFGDVEGDGDWGWQLFGHHVVVNFVEVDGRHVVAPVFIGAEPALSDGVRPPLFDEREQWALELAGSLDEEQRARAIVFDSVLDPAMPEGRVHPADERHVAGAFRDNRVIPYEGIRADALQDHQWRMLTAIVEDFALLLKTPHRAAYMSLIERHRENTWFSWYGATDGSQPFYFRIQSPVVVAELDHHAGVWLANKVPARFHVHTTFRLPNGNDYGRAYLGRT